MLATGLLAVAQLDAAFDFTARGVGGYGFAQCPFEVAQIFWHFELDVEIAVVDRAQFDIQAFAAMFGAAVGKTGHAFDHNFLLSIQWINCSPCFQVAFKPPYLPLAKLPNTPAHTITSIPMISCQLVLSPSQKMPSRVENTTVR